LGAKKIMDAYRQIFGLTDSQARVLHWLTEGKRNREIAVLLGISPRTVEKHVEQVLTKLEVETRTSAVARALEKRSKA